METRKIFYSTVGAATYSRRILDEEIIPKHAALISDSSSPHSSLFVITIKVDNEFNFLKEDGEICGFAYPIDSMLRAECYNAETGELEPCDLQNAYDAADRIYSEDTEAGTIVTAFFDKGKMY